ALPMGWLYDRYGPRPPLMIASILVGGGIALCSQVTALWQLYLLFGVVAGVGFGAIYPVPVATVVKWFLKRRGMAVGIVTSGGGVGMFVMPHITEPLISSYSWQAAFMVIGLMFMVLIGVSALAMKDVPKGSNYVIGVVSQPEDTEAVPTGTPHGKDMTPRQALRDRAFWMFYLAFIFAVAADRMASLEVIDYGRSIGLPRAAAAGALGFMGLGSIGGRLFIGTLSDRLGRRATLTMCFALQGLALLAVPSVGGAAMLSTTMCILGLAYGGFVALYGPIVGEAFGLTHLGKILGLSFTNGIWAAILGPLVLGGYLVDITGGYQWSFILGGVSCGIAAVLTFAARPTTTLPEGG
ncbi:MAG: MFS transporter, partial [Dehalococcoidia bacterium]|nr:MFS transporter [Dehalococcoidia bacterium]